MLTDLGTASNPTTGRASLTMNWPDALCAGRFADQPVGAGIVNGAVTSRTMTTANFMGRTPTVARQVFVPAALVGLDSDLTAGLVAGVTLLSLVVVAGLPESESFLAACL